MKNEIINENRAICENSPPNATLDEEWTQKLDSDLYSTQDWGELVAEFAPFNGNPLSYIDSPKHLISPEKRASIIYKARPNDPNSDQYGFGKIPFYQYIHDVRLRTELPMGKRNLNFQGYWRDPEISKNTKFLFEEKYYRGGTGGDYFTLKGVRTTPPASKSIDHMDYLDIRFHPRFRQNLWESVKWMEETIRLIRSQLGVSTPRLNYLEIPIDFELGNWDYESITPCLWRNYAGEILANSKDGYGVTFYDGPNKKAGKVKIYLKRGCWHLEPTFQKRHFWQKPERKFLSTESILFFLLEIFKNNSFRYPDYGKLTRSNKVRSQADKAWGRFLHGGNRAYINFLKGHCGYQNNATRFLKEHPFNPHFKNALAVNILKGLEMTGFDVQSEFDLSDTESLGLQLQEKLPECSEHASNRSLIRHHCDF